MTHSRVLILAAWLLTGCTEAPSREGPNLLADPAFERPRSGTGAIWQTSQHAGARSFRWSATDGVLTAAKTGPEPWGQATQSVSAKDLVGHRMAFVAELAGELEPDSERTVEATGIAVRILGITPGTPRVLGPSIQLVRLGQPPLPRGEFGWTAQRVEFVVPEGAFEIEVSIRLGTGGTLRARNPRLFVVDGD